MWNTFMISFWYLYFWFWTYFTPSSVSIVDFEQADVYRELSCFIPSIILTLKEIKLIFKLIAWTPDSGAIL